MLMKKLALLFFRLFSISAAFAALPTPIDVNFSFNGSNAVQVAWNAYPGKSYVLQTATNLSGSWSKLLDAGCRVEFARLQFSHKQTTMNQKTT